MRSVAASNERTEVIRSFDGLAALEPEWPQSRAWGPLVSHAWFLCAARAFCEAGALHVVTVRREGRLVAVAPLYRTRRLGIPWLETIGARQLYEPTELPALDHQAQVALCRAMVRQRLPLIVQRLSRDDAIVTLLAQVSGKGTLRVLDRPATHFLPIPGSAERTEPALTPHRRKKLRYARRALAASGELSTRILTPSSDELPALLEEVFRVEGSGWKGRRATALSTNPRLRQFVSELSEGLTRIGALRVCQLLVADRCIAVQLCAQLQDRFWVLKIGFDERFAKFSPGMLLNEDLVRHAAGEQQAGFEFLGAVEEWQRPWSPLVRAHCAAVYYPPSVAGRAALWMDDALAGLRRMRKQTSGGM